jgi:hypothetical protein
MKFIVRRFAEQVQYIEVDAETQDDAYELATAAHYDKWSEWECCSDPGEIDYDSIEEVNDERPTSTECYGVDSLR